MYWCTVVGGTKTGAYKRETVVTANSRKEETGSVWAAGQSP